MDNMRQYGPVDNNGRRSSGYQRLRTTSVPGMGCGCTVVQVVTEGRLFVSF